MVFGRAHRSLATLVTDSLVQSPRFIEPKGGWFKQKNMLSFNIQHGINSQHLKFTDNQCHMIQLNVTSTRYCWQFTEETCTTSVYLPGDLVSIETKCNQLPSQILMNVFSTGTEKTTGEESYFLYDG